jgi:hypothetical protein
MTVKMIGPAPGLLTASVDHDALDVVATRMKVEAL